MTKKQKKLAKEDAKQEKLRKKQEKLVKKQELEDAKQLKVLKKKKKLESVTQKQQIEKLKVVYHQFTVSGSPHAIFKNLPSSLAVNENTEKFRKVILARYKDEEYHTYFIQYHKKGEPGFPVCDGIKIYNETLQQSGYYPVQGVALHPSGHKKVLFDIGAQ